MPEVAGDAALLVNPFEVQEIATAMQQMLINAELREKVVQKGWERKDLFSWDRTANLMWNCIEKTM